MKMALAIALFFGIASLADAVVECLILDGGSALYAGATTDATTTTNMLSTNAEAGHEQHRLELGDAPSCSAGAVAPAGMSGSPMVM
jgi:hypothetical protein